jgi:hypothetical protein
MLALGLAQGAALQGTLHAEGSGILSALGGAFGGQLVATSVALLASAGAALPRQPVVVRPLGGWLVAIGLLVLALRVADCC